MNTTSRAALLLGTAVFAGTALAEENTEIIELEEIRIQEGEAQSTLGNLEVTPEEIERRNPATVSDVFAAQTSVTTSSGASIAQKTFVLGIEESLLSVTIDGARQNKGAFHHTGNVLIDPSLLEQVDVTSGLAPADAGPGGLGGSIAYTFKDASDLLEPGETFGGMLNVSGGDNGYGIRTNLSVFGQSGGFEYLLSGSLHNGDDYKDGDGVTIEGTEPDITDYMAKLSYTTDQGHKFSFSASETEDTGTRIAQAGPGGLLFIRPDFSGLTSGPNTLIDGYARRTSYSFTYTNEQPTAMFDPTVQIAYNEQEVDAGGVQGTNTSLSGKFQNQFSIANGTITAGIDFFDEKAEGSTDAPFTFAGTEKNRNVGIFAQARQDLGDRVSVSYGARYDWQNFTGADGSEFSDSGLSANGAIDILLTDSLTLNAGLASTWGGYQLGEASLINFFTPWTYNGFQASSSTSAKIGLRFAQGPWEARGSYYITKIDDVSAILPTGGDRAATTNIESEGFDGSVAYFWASGFARFNYTYSDVTSDGDIISSTAYYYGRPMGHQFALEAAWQPHQDWTVGGLIQAAASLDGVDDGSGTGTLTNLPAYQVLDLYATYTPPRFQNLTLRLDVKNLFNETYVVRGADAAGQTGGRAIALNDPGRTIILSANLRF